MPTHPPKACTQPGCNALVYDRSGRCLDHRYDRSRPSSAKRGYDRTWQRIREGKLARDPFCEDPFHVHNGVKVQAIEVDHIISLGKGGTHAFSNLQSLCDPCHNKKTNQEDGGGWRRR